MEAVKAVRDESGHWYVIPMGLADDFSMDNEDEQLCDSGEFDNKYGKYRTGGDLNLIQLYAEL